MDNFKPSDFIPEFNPMPEAEFRKYLLAHTIYPAIERWGFESQFHFERLGEMIPMQRDVYLGTKQLLRNKGAIVALVGPRGLGKTTVAAQIAIDQAWKNYESSIRETGPRSYAHVVYRKTAKLVGRYKSLFADYGSVDTDSLMESLDYFCREHELVVIDELHDCDDQKMKLRVLTDVVDRRYSMCRDTILISNQTAEDFSATVGDSIFSRLNQFGAIIECKWESFR